MSQPRPRSSRTRRLDRRTLLRGGLAVGATAATATVGQPSLATAARTLGRAPTHAAVDLRMPLPAWHLAEVMGVRTRLQAAESTTYGDVALVRRSLQELGMHRTREKLILPASADGYANPWMARQQRDAWRHLAEQIPGFNVCSTVGRIDDSEGTVTEFRAYVADRLGGDQGVVTAVENANEPNATGDGWVGPTRRRQQQMAQEFRADPRTAGITLLGPSLGGTFGPGKYADLGDLRPHVDVANIHHYPGFTDEGLPATQLDQILEGCAVNCGDRPAWVTEIGLHGATAANGAEASYPAELAAQVGLQAPFELLRRGIRHGYVYELLDVVPDPDHTDPTANYGLVQADGEPKPLFHALANLHRVLTDDPHLTHTLQPLDIHLLEAPDDLQHLLLQKRDGRSYLALWRTVPLPTRNGQKTVQDSPQPVTVGLGIPHTVSVFAPTVSDQPQQTTTSTARVGVQVGLAPVLLEIA